MSVTGMGKIWTAVAERSDDTALGDAERRGHLVPSKAPSPLRSADAVHISPLPAPCSTWNILSIRLTPFVCPNSLAPPDPGKGCQPNGVRRMGGGTRMTALFHMEHSLPKVPRPPADDLGGQRMLSGGENITRLASAAPGSWCRFFARDSAIRWSAPSGMFLVLRKPGLHRPGLSLLRRKKLKG